MRAATESPSSGRGIVWFVLLCIALEAWIACWRAFWNGIVIPVIDWVRYGLFWRVVEKVRLMVLRR